MTAGYKGTFLSRERWCVIRDLPIYHSHQSIANVDNDKPVLNDAVSSEISASNLP
jgi:hypothetical protein